MSHNVAVGEFEGPLGILLDLVERGNLEVTAISVGKITAEYLVQVRRLKTQSAEELGEFLQLGARLLYIKSLALLPQQSQEQQADELRQLNQELAEYRKFQAAARALSDRHNQQTWARPVGPRLTTGELPWPDLKLDQLAEAFSRALRSAPVAPTVSVARQAHSLEKIMATLRRRLPNGFELQTAIDACRDRLEIIVTFLALLELIRAGAARVRQAGQFDPITVEPARD